MSRVLRERVERVALRYEPESVLQEPIEKGKVKFKQKIRSRRERDKTSSNSAEADKTRRSSENILAVKAVS